MKIAAVIFDLDGTVIDNEDEYGAAFRTVLRGLGKRVDKEFPHEGGIGVKENWPLLLSKYKIKTRKSIEELARETQDAYLKQLPRVTFKKGVQRFIGELRKSGISTALATSNARWIVDEVSGELDLLGLFDVITTGEEVDYKKPDPDLFLLTAKKLRIDPTECLVFEDSKAGIEAAHRAGMRAVGLVRDDKHAKELKEANVQIRNFDELTPEIISTL